MEYQKIVARERNFNGIKFLTKNVTLCPGERAKRTVLPDQHGIEEPLVGLSEPPAKQGY